jgi:hypothetical protein
LYELPDDRDGATAFAFLDALWADRIRRVTVTQPPPAIQEPPPGRRADEAPAENPDAPDGGGDAT